MDPPSNNRTEETTLSSSGGPPEGVSGTEVELEYWALGQVGCRGGVIEGERVTVAQCDPHYFGFQIEDMEINRTQDQEYEFKGSYCSCGIVSPFWCIGLSIRPHHFECHLPF